MTEQEYNQQLIKLKKDYEFNVNRLNEGFALSNNPYNEGCIFQDHIGKIKVESIDVVNLSGYALPSCVYEGVELKIDGTPRVKVTRRKAFQVNEVKK